MELAKLRVSGAPGVRQFRFRDFTAGPARQFATTTPVERQSGSLLIRRSHPAAGPHLTQSRISFVPDADAAEYAEAGGAADAGGDDAGIGDAVAERGPSEAFRPSWAATAKERRAAREARAAASSAPPRLLAVSERAVASLPRAAHLAGVSESAPAPEDASAGAEQRASSWAATAKERRAARDERCRLAFQLGRQPSSCCLDPSTYQRESSSYNLASGVSPAYMASIGNQAGREPSGFQQLGREPSSYSLQPANAATGVPPPDIASSAYSASVPARSGKGPAAPTSLGKALRAARPIVSVAEAAATAAAAAAAARQIGGIGDSGGSGAGSFRQFRFREGATPPARQFATTTPVERQPADEDVSRFARLARLAELAQPLVEKEQPLGSATAHGRSLLGLR